MRAIEIPMPAIARKDRHCCFCGDELTPRIKACMIGSYDPKAHSFTAKYAHPQCARKDGVLHDEHIVPAGKVLSVWQGISRILAGARK